MAIQLEQILYNADVVRYHRISGIEVNGHIVTAVLDSFRSFDQRELPIAPVITRKFPFTYSGDPSGIFSAGYLAIKALPEWSEAIDV